MNPISILAYDFFHNFVTQGLAFLPKLVVGILVFLLFWLFAYVCKFILFRLYRRLKRNATVFPLVMRIVQAVILILGAVTALGTIGVNVTALVASLGLFGFAAGIAFKDLLSNTVAGVMIILYRPFIVNDQIEGANFAGKVTKINLRYTVLGEDDTEILVPNSLVLSNVIKIKR